MQHTQCLGPLDLALEAQALEQGHLCPRLFISVQTILGRFLQKHPSVEMLFFIICYVCLLSEKHYFCFHAYTALTPAACLRWLTFLHHSLCQNAVKRIKCPNVMLCYHAARLSLPDRGQQWINKCCYFFFFSWVQLKVFERLNSEIKCASQRKIWERNREKGAAPYGLLQFSSFFCLW